MTKKPRKTEKNWENWENVEIPGKLEILSDLSTSNLIHHIEQQSALSTSPEATSGPSPNLATEILNKHTRDFVRIEVHRVVYNQVVRAIKKANSRITVPAFIEALLCHIFNQENL